MTSACTDEPQTVAGASYYERPPRIVSPHAICKVVLCGMALAALTSCTTGSHAPHGNPSSSASGTATAAVTPHPERGSQQPSGPAPQPTTSPSVKPGLAGSRRTTGTTAVALTFDDGPDPDLTPHLLDLLKTNQVSATFCLVGSRARRYPRLVARIAAEGHTLCNHTWNHPETLYQRSDQQILADLTRTNAAIHRAAPQAPIRYFRAPYGNFTPRLINLAGRLGMVSLGWNVDDQCYLSARYGTGITMVNRMTARVRRNTRPGSIILSHDLDKPQTLAAYQSLLPWLGSRFQLAAMPTDTSTSAHERQTPTGAR